MEISVNVFISLDGVMQGPGAVQEDPSEGFERGGWLVPHSTAGQLDPVEGWFRRAEALLLGRTTFELMRSYWPLVTDEDNAVATALNTGKKYVVSNTLADDDTNWGDTTVLRGDFIEQVRRLKERPGGELQVHGSWQLVRGLHDAGLVDTYRLLQFPVVIGDGKRLFADGVPASYQITESEILTGGAGAILLTLSQTQFRTISAGEFAVQDGMEAIV
ncbi:dihydrofolate reductase family protein [Nocardia sp. NPDC003963]